MKYHAEECEERGYGAGSDLAIVKIVNFSYQWHRVAPRCRIDSEHRYDRNKVSEVYCTPASHPRIIFPRMLNIFVSACLYSNNAVTVREGSYGTGRQLRYGKAVTVQEGSYGAGRDPVIVISIVQCCPALQKFPALLSTESSIARVPLFHQKFAMTK